MKLLSLTNRYYFVFIIIIVIVGGFATYQILKTSINAQFNKKLLIEKEQLIYELHQYEYLKDAYYLNIGDKITLEQIDESASVPLSWLDTLLIDEYQNAHVAYRQLKFSENVDGQNYLITISKSLLSTDELIRIIEQVMFFMMLTLMASLILVSNRISKKLWASFYDSLSFLRNYDIKNPQAPDFLPTNIEEFKQLNEVVGLMIQKSIHDYETLKEFSENASHEIQTPLAIIKSKSELLLQDERLSEELVNGISAIYAAANRLSHLNHDLAFLTKIDNNEFISVKPINLKEFIENKLSQLEDLIRMKRLKIVRHFYEECTVQFHESLCYVLISNLLNNAILHNIPDGTITINLTKLDLEIINSGRPLRIDPNLLFRRFKKDSHNKESSGLGLALVKKICDYYNHEVKYTYYNGHHKIAIVFKRNKTKFNSPPESIEIADS